MTLPLSPGSADALLFDLGRVVLDIDFSKAMTVGQAMPAVRLPHLAARFVREKPTGSTRSGKIDDAAFFENLRASLGIGITDAQFLEGWNAIFAGEMPGIAPLLARASNRLPLFAFSNTNRPHVEYFSQSLCRGARPFPRNLPVFHDRASETRCRGL